ncbi:putative tail fiber protein [Pseudomonas phage PAK_P3]|uniref:Putative tail fiber protein n=2 Tax=Nankokuvirus PAKP3 TaxID=1925782 RepID=F2W605_9CAUD|nr:tail fiber protein [Pseudomonas phage PAK_P3]ADX32025.1 putative tail fiber protein [Pseudomonas phage P3_CHA]ADX32210.1 putative tail fiber protein [Pseudomonas phage PAK_P3]
MANINKISMNLIWGVSGDITAPGPEKMNKGWEVEVVPRQWLNYLQNRLDTNVAYLLQKGLPEWDSETEYQANTSYVQRNGVVYKASRTNTNSEPGTTAGNTNWNRAFQEWSPALESLTSLTPTAWRFPFYNASGQATLGGITSYTVGLMGLSSDAAWRAELKAQTSASQLTWLSNLTPVVGAIPYFNTATSMANLATTPFGRNWIGVADAATGRSQLQLGSAAVMTATAINQASTVVARDSTGTAAIGTVIGSLTGNASTATRLQTGRNINGVLFDGTQDITLPPLTADYAGIVARLHINGANMSGTDKTTQLALRNKSNTDWISLAVIEDNILQFAFRNTSNPIVQIGGEVVLHTGNQFSLGPTLSDARSRLGLDRVSQGSSDTVVFASTLNNGPYLTVQPSSVGGFNGGTQTWMFRFDETGTLTHGTVPVARVSGLANSAQIPAVTTAQSNSLVQRDSSGSFSAVGINAYGSIIGYGSNIFSRSSGTGNAHIGFQKADGSELGLIWGAPSNGSMNFRTLGGSTGMTLTGQDLTVVGRVNAATLNASGNANVSGNVNVGSATLNTAGNITGPAYGAYNSLTNWVDSVYAKKGEIPNDIARAGAAWDAVGQYILAGDQSGGSGGPGTIRAGSQLKPYSTISYTAGALPAAGQYRCMGAFAGGGNQITLWQRIS